MFERFSNLDYQDFGIYILNDLHFHGVAKIMSLFFGNAPTY